MSPPITKKSLKRFLLSASNVSRALFISLFGLIVNYILLHYKSEIFLESYVYCISIVNLLFVVSNWGGRDHALKIFTKNPDKLPDVFNSLLSSKFILLVFVLVIFWVLPISLEFKIFISAYLVLKSLSAVFETLITTHKKFHTFLLTDLLLNLGFIALILLDNNRTDPAVFLLELCGIELIRLLLSALYFRKLIVFRISLKKGIDLLKTSRTFFYMSLAGFVCSRGDLYIVGLAFDRQQMSFYFILLNLVSLSHITYTTFQNTWASNIFRYNHESFKKFSRFSTVLGLVFSAMAALSIYIISALYYQTPISTAFTLIIFLNVFVFVILLTEMYRCTRLGKQLFALYTLIISGIVNLVISWILIGRLGTLGAFIGNTAGNLCTFLIMRLALRDNTAKAGGSL